VKAKDEGVKTDLKQGSVAFVCFRSEADSFFVFSLDAPLWLTHYDAETKMNVRDDEGVVVSGHVSEFVDGIADNRTMPIGIFSGSWHNRKYPFSLADKIDFQDRGEHSSVVVDNVQISATSRYMNQFKTNIDYELVIQRSTGRFRERYTTQGEQSPFNERQGRCVTPTQKPVNSNP
jgi:hypothetical protein